MKFTTVLGYSLRKGYGRYDRREECLTDVGGKGTAVNTEPGEARPRAVSFFTKLRRDTPKKI